MFFVFSTYKVANLPVPYEWIRHGDGTSRPKNLWHHATSRWLNPIHSYPYLGKMNSPFSTFTVCVFFCMGGVEKNTTSNSQELLPLSLNCGVTNFVRFLYGKKTGGQNWGKTQGSWGKTQGNFWSMIWYSFIKIRMMMELIMVVLIGYNSTSNNYHGIVNSQYNISTTIVRLILLTRKMLVLRNYSDNIATTKVGQHSSKWLEKNRGHPARFVGYFQKNMFSPTPKLILRMIWSVFGCICYWKVPR